jgi:tetratricopeptide (TPR) repeat protein
MTTHGSRWFLWTVGALALLALGAGGAKLLWLRPSLPHPSQAAPSDDDDIAELVVANPGYVGPQVCAECHATRVAQFLKTNHFRACREPCDGAMPAGFAPGKGTFAARESGLRFEMTQSGGDFLHTAVQATSAGEKHAATRIAWVYGAGDADDVYFGWHGDKLYELPVSWLHPQQQWGIAPRYRYSTENDFSRDATPRCVECHNTWVGHVAGTLNEYRREGAILGVTCERCHGPGSDHVAFHRAHPGAKTGEHIVHPGRLSRDGLMDLCAQCHSNAIKYRGPAFSYRPGQPLEASFKSLATKHPEDDHVANQTQYLRQSKCFQTSDTLTCTTCHNPHRPKGPTAAAAVEPACLQCHKPAQCGAQARLPEAVRENCIGCHMPRGIKINVHFHTKDDTYVAPILRSQHRIAVYPAAEQAVLLAWHRSQPDAASQQEAGRLAKTLVAHWLSEAEQCRRDYRFMAAIAAVREGLRVDPTPAVRKKLLEATAMVDRLEADTIAAGRQFHEQRYAEAIESYKRILAVKPDQAIAHGKLGMLYWMTGRNEEAVAELELVAKYDADEPYGYSVLGWMNYLQGKPGDALEFYRRADEIEPFDSQINYKWGLALLKVGQAEEAGERFRQALQADPRHAGACQSLSHALRRQGQWNEAVRFARRAVRLTNGDNADVLLSLADAYADAGRFTEADGAIAEALEAARRTNKELLPRIHERGEEIRHRARQPRES